MSSVEIRWTAAPEDSDDEIPEQTSILGGFWADCEANGEAAVNEICEDYFRTDEWESWFGVDDTTAEVRVRVRSPSSIAGEYRVALRRVTKASAERVPTDVVQGQT